MILRGQQGDATVLRPTFMACVPLILERMHKAILEGLNKKGGFFLKLFDFCVKYKLEALRRGEVTPIMDRLIFHKFKAIVGGKMRMLLSGGAPLAADAHDFVRTCLGITLLQARITLL